MRTEQTLPDGSKIVVYSNWAGGTMLHVNIDPAGTNQWATFTRYDDATGQPIWTAMPSAVTGYDDNYDDLLNYNAGTGLYQYLRSGDGLIRITEYYASGANQYSVSAEKLRQGQSGTTVLVITHDHAIASGLPRQVSMRDGMVV